MQSDKKIGGVPLTNDLRDVLGASPYIATLLADDSVRHDVPYTFSSLRRKKKGS